MITEAYRLRLPPPPAPPLPATLQPHVLAFARGHVTDAEGDSVCDNGCAIIF